MCMADKFPESLPGFQKMFPDDAACARYLEAIRWRDGFQCPKCGATAEPFRFAARPHQLRCKGCKRDTSLVAGTVMERTHTPLSTWFWAAFLISALTPGMSAVQLQRQLGLTRYETAFQILHKLRASMAVTSGRIGYRTHVEVDETWIGGVTRGRGRGVHEQVCVVGAVEVKQRKTEPEREDGKGKPRRGGRYAGRLRLAVVPDRGAKALTGFVQNVVDPATDMVVTDAHQGYAPLARLGYQHLAVAERGEPNVAEDYLPIIHLIFSNLKAWLNGVHHGVSPGHLQAYLNEFVFRFNRRFYPFNAFRSLLDLSVEHEAPTYAELYDGDWTHPTTTDGSVG
jgi:ISXO2-like transposase domain/Transposase zinc-ribbon domain